MGDQALCLKHISTVQRFLPCLYSVPPFAWKVQPGHCLFSETHYFSYSVMRIHFQQVQIRCWEATQEATGNYILPEHFVCNVMPASQGWLESWGFYMSKPEWHGMEKHSKLFSLGQTITLQMYLERPKVWAEQSWHGWRVYFTQTYWRRKNKTQTNLSKKAL